MDFIVKTMFFFACGLFLLSCDNKNSSGIENLDDLQNEFHEGMIFVLSKGSSALLGSNDTSVVSTEQHQMTVSFDYNFFLDKHEVTCDDYVALMKKGSKSDCDEGSKPIANVTYYDAVLFANARSKSEGLDTVYSYSGSSYDSDGNCVFLENLSFHPKVSAYRLPTEAEWVYAAQQGWKTENGWFSENSDYKSHSVCSLPTNKLGFCDLAGNVKEWVNDWKGFFKEDTVANYIGAPNGGELGERVLKGGCFKNSASSVKIFHRGDTYMVSSSTKGDYVGFRLAYGPIKNFQYLNADGITGNSFFFVETSPITLRSVTGSFRSKIVFRNEDNGNLVFVDYNEVDPSAIEIKDTIDSYHPDISPDGSKVAFCTSFEGFSSKSELYVRNLNVMNSGLVKLDVESAAIPRWRVLDNGDTVIVYVSSAEDNSDELVFKKESTWQVPFSNGKFGEPKKLFDGAFHGGVSRDDSFAVSGSRLLKARMGDVDTVLYNGEQACNVSLAKDGSKRILFLDFASETGRSFVGEKYNPHQYLFIADSTGKLINAIRAPEKYTFDHSEWFEGNLIVASLSGANGTHQKIVLVDANGGEPINLISGADLWHPALWVDKGKKVWMDSFDEDSLGVYLVDDGPERSKILRYRMELYWRYRDSVNVVVLGSSRSSNGVDSAYFSNKFRTLNMSFFPSSLYDVKLLYDRYIDGAVPRLKYLVVSLDLDIFRMPESAFFHEEYKIFPGYVYDEHHGSWRNLETEPIYKATSLGRGFPMFSIFLTNRSTEFFTSTGWGNHPEVAGDSTLASESSVFYFQQFSILKDLAAEGYEKGFYVVGVIFPMSPGYAQTGSFGRQGVRRSFVPTIMDSLDAWRTLYPNLYIFDENKMGNHDYTSDMAQDFDHLNKKGAAKLTTRLNEFLLTLD